ncbi:MAG: polysaccharide deacetylase family protein [Oscillospiraceae bacterium]|nr:polysaccharide deacetylase family protein [Oscillospiraceae bacterium]
MSLVTKGIGLAKKAKHHFQDQIKERTPVYLSPVRRIERVASKERICAMTFDDGPCRLPPSPDHFRGKALTLVLAELLERYSAKGTFDVVGDTSANYPDKPGKHGSASWGGVSYDHYPDFKQDANGGAANCPDLIARLLAGGHEITSHTYSHVLFGWKPLVYGRRHYLSGLDPVVEDLKRLHSLMETRWGYRIRLSRPPHYVDSIRGGFSSYDAYALMGYQYMAANYDGAGWLPLATYEAEVEAMWRPMERLLLETPDAFCGQIIFQKDGYNMARRSPVADGLDKQLQLLTDHGYRIVTVSELLEHSPFEDVFPDSEVGTAARRLLNQGWCVAYQDNTIRPDSVLTRGELAMMLFGWESVPRRIAMIRSGRAPFRDLEPRHPYSGAAAQAVQSGAATAVGGRFRPGDPVTAVELAQFCSTRMGKTPPLLNRDSFTHEEFFRMAVKLMEP